MCSQFSQDQKSQPCEKLLPAGWRFFFEDRSKNPQYFGLFICNSNHHNQSRKYCFRSFENASSRSLGAFKGLDAGLFYKEVGISPEKVPKSVSKSSCKESTKLEQPIINPSDCRISLDDRQTIFWFRCSECPSCIRDACGACDSCTRGQRGSCLRRVSVGSVQKLGAFFAHYLITHLLFFSAQT